MKAVPGVDSYMRALTDALRYRHVLLAAGWVAFALVVHRASSIEGEAVAFDPFKILGVSTVRRAAFVEASR